MPPSLQNDHFSDPIYTTYPQTQPTSYSPNTSWYPTNTTRTHDPPPPSLPQTQTTPSNSNSTNAAKVAKATPQDIEKLRRLPELRSIPWRKGKECGPEKSTHSSRPQTRGAFLLVTRGNVRSPACSHCETGAGRFEVCVSLNEWYHGACATCVMATRGNKCSLRQDVEEGLLPADGGVQSADENNDEDGSKYSLKRKRSDRSPTKAYVSEYSPVEQVGGDQQAALANMTNANHYPSYNPAPTTNQYLPQTRPYTSSADTQAQAQQEKSSMLDYGYKEYPSNGKNIDSTEKETSNGPLTNKRIRLSDRGQTQSMSPNLHQAHLPQTNFIPTGSGTSTMYQAEPETVSLIDTLSKKKQREIFGILGSLQSGIRLVKQQTDSLQKQLDVLQSALGIDLDDEDEDAHA